MTASAFGHGVFGIVVPKGGLSRKLKSVAAKYSDVTPIVDILEEDDEDHELVIETKEASQALRKHYSLPDDFPAHVFYTGDEDKRPGECATDPELWLFGIGIYQLVETTLKWPAAIQELKDRSAQLHTWVTTSD